MTSKREEVMNMTHILEKVIYEHEEEYGEIIARNLLREHIERAILERFHFKEHNYNQLKLMSFEDGTKKEVKVCVCGRIREEVK